MASAGRILLMPKGNYSASVTYVMLDMVRYNNALWVCKKQCIGIPPAEGEYWQLGTEYVADAALSESSTNPVQNKAVTEKLNEITGNVSALQADLEGTGLSVLGGQLCITYESED